MHHYRNAPCEGAGFPPIEQDDARLAELVEASVETAAEHKRLKRRLQRHRSWPERFRREMERDGYGQPPPEYLWSRK
jgi:hypothetical protein